MKSGLKACKRGAVAWHFYSTCAPTVYYIIQYSEYYTYFVGRQCRLQFSGVASSRPLRLTFAVPPTTSRHAAREFWVASEIAIRNTETNYRMSNTTARENIPNDLIADSYPIGKPTSRAWARLRSRWTKHSFVACSLEQPLSISIMSIIDHVMMLVSQSHSEIRSTSSRSETNLETLEHHVWKIETSPVLKNHGEPHRAAGRRSCSSRRRSENPNSQDLTRIYSNQ